MVQDPSSFPFPTTGYRPSSFDTQLCEADQMLAWRCPRRSRMNTVPTSGDLSIGQMIAGGGEERIC
jgi:hypothetical protein